MGLGSYENPWLFDNEPFELEDVKKYEGFVYLIINKDNGRRYVGRKYFLNRRTPRGKKRKAKSNSNWKDYYGSSETLKADVEKFGKDNFERHILSLHLTRGDCNRCEIEYLWKLNALYEELYYNDSIGKYKGVPDRIMDGRVISTTLKNMGI